MKRNLLAAISIALSFAPGAGASDQIPAPKQTRPVAITGATIHTVSGPVIENATIVFDEGKISAIGSDAAIPAEAERVEAGGKHVYPGLIAANTCLGLVEVSAVRATRDYAETGDVNPNVRAEVSVNPDTELLPVARANGITMALTIPLSGVISGTSALIRMDGWTWEDLTYAAPIGLHVFWPSAAPNPWGPTRSEAERKKRRDDNIAKIEGAFESARAYAKARAATEARGETFYDTDLRWEAMIPVLEREIPVFVHADDMSDIEAAVDWAASENLDLVIVGGYDAWRLADLLRANHVSVIVADIHRTPQRRWEDYDTPFELPLRLYEAGVPFCIATGGGGFGSAHVRNLPYHAAMAAAYGLPKEEAIRSVTLYPAQILGVGDRVGSLEVGKDATLIVTDGDPLEITTHVELEFIDGRRIDLHSRHTQLYEKYKAKYEQLRQEDSKRVSSTE